MFSRLVPALKTILIKMSYHILVASLTLMALFAPALRTIFHQNVVSYTCSQSNSDGSVKTEPSELDWLQVYDMTF